MWEEVVRVGPVPMTIPIVVVRTALYACLMFTDDSKFNSKILTHVTMSWPTGLHQGVCVCVCVVCVCVLCVHSNDTSHGTDITSMWN